MLLYLGELCGDDVRRKEAAIAGEHLEDGESDFFWELEMKRGAD